MAITHLRHVAIFSPDLDKQRKFYGTIWGLVQIEEEIDAVYFRGASPEHHLLSLHAAKRCGLHHIAFGVSDEVEVERTAWQLQSRGIRLVSEPQPLSEPGSGYGFRFIDPENRCIELSAGVVQHQGGWQTKAVQPHSICHVVLNTAQIDAMIEFYTLLGFRISDWSEQQMVFLRCNTKHHSIALSRAPHASVNHIAYLVSNVDEVMRGMVNMRKHGFEPGWGPGRHGPGNNIFCYFKEPVNYVVEYTSDIDYIQDEASHQPKVWPRTPDLIDRWGTAGPPGADIRQAMEGKPDPGWQPSDTDITGMG